MDNRINSTARLLVLTSFPIKKFVGQALRLPIQERQAERLPYKPRSGSKGKINIFHLQIHPGTLKMFAPAAP